MILELSLLHQKKDALKRAEREAKPLSTLALKEKGSKDRWI
jgi:hypothetical protein